MDKTSLILSALMLVAFAIFLAPGIFAMNRGKVLRNIAIWLAVFAALGLFYKTFGPESRHPLFRAPYGVVIRTPSEIPPPLPPKDKDDVDDDAAGHGKPGDDARHDNGGQGFTPPGE